MFIIKVADFIIEIQNQYGYLEKLCKDYVYNGNQQHDFSVSVTDEEIEKQLNMSGAGYSKGYCECVCTYRKICLKVLEYDAMFMHGSLISFDGRGILFTAQSGVGKSTHTAFWKELYGDSVTVVNGDKPIIRFIDGVPYAYGTPWSGKEGWQVNTKVLLQDICFIERSEENLTERTNPADKLESLLHQLILPKNSKVVLKTLELMDILCNKCNFWTVKCNPTVDAAKTAHDVILEELK